jgi:ACR3 family arsenite transporter
LGEVSFDVWLVAESVVLYLGIPLVAGFFTRRWGVKKYGEEGFKKVKSYLDSLSIIGLLFTLIVMFALKGDLIVAEPGIILKLAVPMTLFFWSIFVVVYLVGWKLGFNYKDATALAFNSTGRDFEIAIAIVITAFNPIAGAGNGRRSAHRSAGDAGVGVVCAGDTATPVWRSRRAGRSRRCQS